MEEQSEILKNNRTEDVAWLCSLSESELDLLISLKKLAIQRAKIICNEELANNFDLKMLRALGLVVMENVRKRVQDETSLAAGVENLQLGLLDNCNLLKTNVDDTIDIDDILTEICNKTSTRKSRKRKIRCLVAVILLLEDEKGGLAAEKAFHGLICQENLVVSVSKMDLERNKNAWDVLNLS